MGGVFNTVNLHLYHYAGNNPLKYTDPDGRMPFLVVTGAIGAAIGAGISIASDLTSGRDINWNKAGLSAATGLTIGLGAGALTATAATATALTAGSATASFSAVTGYGVAGVTTAGVVAAAETTKKGISVIGPRDTYAAFAEKVGANYLDPTGWSQAKNDAFISGVIERGDDVFFAGKFDPSKLDPGSVLAGEIQQLIDAGYKWVDNFSKLIKE
jgi:hypothetical protein